MLAVRRGDLIGERAADAAESEQDDVGRGAGCAAAAADLRQLKRRVHAPRRLRRIVGRSTANEMLRSDDPCAMATTLMRAGGERREHARGDARRAGHAVADDGDDRHARLRA